MCLMNAFRRVRRLMVDVCMGLGKLGNGQGVRVPHVREFDSLIW